MEGNMMKPQDSQMEKPPMNQYNPFDAQSTSKMIQPTGGSQMLPPFGNQGVSPDEWKKKEEMNNDGA